MRVTKQSIAKMLCNIHEHVCGVKKVANGIRANCAVDSVDMRLTSTLRETAQCGVCSVVPAFVWDIPLVLVY